MKELTLKKAAFAISLIVIVVMTSLIVFELFERNRYYTVHLDIDNNFGLEINDPIFLNGDKIGKILEIRYFTIALGILKDDSIPRNSDVDIEVLSFFGKKAILLTSSTNSSFVSPNDTITMSRDSGVVNFLHSMGNRFQQIQNEIDTTRIVLHKLDSVLNEITGNEE